MPKEKDK